VEPDDVPAGPLAVDTDVFSMVHNRRGRHAEFAPLIEGHPLALPFAVVGELRVGAIRGGLQSKRLDALNAAIRTCVVIPTDARVVDKWAELHARFLNRLKGEGINDLWIAACCLVQGLPLVTNNFGDFGQIADEFDDLRLVHPDL
jgi:predicted nucleic acid-binding protein